MKKLKGFILCLLTVSLLSACSPLLGLQIPKFPKKASESADTNQQDVQTDLDNFIKTAKSGLGVPEDLNVTYSIGDSSYWEAGETNLRFVQFFFKNTPVASAYCDAETGDPVRGILNYTPPEQDSPRENTQMPKNTPNTHKHTSPSVRSNPEYTTYRNGRFGFSIDIPDFLHAGREPDNGSGLTFTSSDGTITLIAYGSHDALMYGGIAGLYEARLADAEFPVSYKVQKDNWCVLSGDYDNTVYYQKCIYKSDETINEFLITYPKSVEKTMDSVVTHLYSSFRTGIGDDSEVAK